MPLGRFGTSFAARSDLFTDSVRLVLLVEKTPSSNLRSPSSILSICAAIASRLGHHLFGRKMESRAGDVVGEREPPVPSPIENLVGIALNVLMSSRGSMPRRSQTSCLNTVSWPWPCVIRTGKRGSACRNDRNRTSAPSRARRAARARWCLRCRNRAALPRLRASALRALKPLRSAQLEREVHVLLELAAVIGERRARS